MIEVTSLEKSFPVARHQRVSAITDVSFHAENGRVTGLLGPNGAGKSTTLRILATLMRADSGSAIIDGFEVHTAPLEVRRRIGFLPHDSGIYPRLTARENVQYYADICGVPTHQSRHRTDELIELLDMQEFADRRAQGFSQGQKTKVALARALVHNPKTLMLDEPTNGLDIMATRGLRSIIRRLADEGHCVLFSSHIMQEIEALCDHIAVISDGAVVIEESLAGIRSSTGQHNLEDAFVIAIGESLDNESPDDNSPDMHL